VEDRNCLYREDIASGLSIFELSVDATSECLSTKTEGLAVVVKSAGHRITIKKVTAPTIWLPDGMSIDTATAWLIYIIKYNEFGEQLFIRFGLPDMPSNIRHESDSGQWLTAIEFEDGVRQVHIGTQDEQCLAQYGEKEWMPQRLTHALNNDELIVTAVDEKGLKTTIPDLVIGEQFYLHYLLAESPRCKSQQYPDDWDVSTWYAVDQPQRTLEENWIKQSEELTK
jgi:hypothetical protein